jgi:hypothetical protein
MGDRIRDLEFDILAGPALAVRHGALPSPAAPRRAIFIAGGRALPSTMAKSQRLKTITGPNGRPLTLGDLPPVKPNRWFPAHKANVVAAVLGGLMTADQACERYKLTREEFMIWKKAFDTQGVKGMRVTHRKRSRTPDIELHKKKI